MSRALGSASPKLRSAAIAVAFAILYFLTAVLTDSLIGDAGAAVLWPASGLYLGVMLVAPHRNWRALVCAAAAGSLAAYLYGGSSLQVSIAFAVPSSAEGFLGALLVERIARRRFRLAAPHDLFALVVGGVVVANALMALSAGAVAAQTFDVSFAESWLRWWSADALGMLAVAPIVTAPLRTGLPRPARWWTGPRVAALGGLGAALVAMQLVSSDGADQVYAAQAFLAVLLLGTQGLVVFAAERERIREELGGTRERSARQLDEARRRSMQLSAELAARRVEVIQTGRGQERLSESLRDSERARERAESELAQTTAALAAARRELEELGRDLGLTVADRDRAQTELQERARTAERLEAELAEATDDLARTRNSAEALASEVDRARAETRALDEELETARAENRALENELEVASVQSHALSGELDIARSELGGARDQSQALKTELDRARAQHAALRGEVESAREHTDALNAELEGTRAENVALRGDLESALERGRVLADELESTRAGSGALASEVQSARQRIRALEGDLERTLAERARVGEELSEAGSGRQRLEQELAVAAEREVALRDELERTRLMHQDAELALRDELERTRLAHQDAELALDHARAKFSERREQLERSLAEATEKLARLEGQVADRAEELSSRYDERGTCLSASPAFGQLLGYEPRELVGRPGHELLHPDDRPRLARARASRTRTAFQARLRRKAGDFVWVEVSLDPVWSSGGDRLVELRTTVRRFPLAA
jgi:PAS domain S-box-containing protein